MVQNSVLYVGADDSNHAGTTKGEIIVATFSFDHADSIVKDFPNTRDARAAGAWLTQPEHDYRFTILTAEEYRHSSQNLVKVVPRLVDEYLVQGAPSIRGLNLYFDGRLDSGARQHLKDYFTGRHGIEHVIVDGFIKKIPNGKGKQEKHPHCPPLVYFADIISHQLYQERTFEELSTDPRLVPEE